LVSACEEDRCYNHESDLVKLRSDAEHNLDTGQQMLETERQFNIDTDSVLNVILLEIELINEDYWNGKLKKDMGDWRLENTNELDSLWSVLLSEIEELGFASEIAELEWYGTSADNNYQKAMELNRIKLEMCNK
jgi:hypothetical protein